MPYRMLNLAEEALLDAKQPLTVLEIWSKAKKMGLDKCLSNGEGKVPQNHLNVALSMDFNKSSSPRVTRTETQPYKYYLLDEKASKARISKLKEDVKTENPSSKKVSDIDEDDDDFYEEKKYPYLEKDLHKFLAEFASRGFPASPIYVKTINHTKVKSGVKGKEFLQWINPDIVGFSFPFTYKSTLLECYGNGFDMVKFYSFELKRDISKNNLRECFFQAVSNSSWANEGYIVAANIDDSIREELKLLSSSFGIGVILLNVYEPDLSNVMYPAKNKEEVDFSRMDKLLNNKDFNQFMKGVKNDVASKEHLNVALFDAILGVEDLKLESQKWSKKNG